MKRNKVIALLMSAVMTLGISAPSTGAADTATDKAEYQYFLNTDEASAYVEFGEKVTGKSLEFIDGLAMGITDKSDILYNEFVTLDGLDARKQYNTNSAYFKLDKNFYEDGDTEFLFSIVFYDFGPSEGKFYFEYHSTTGELKQVTIIKPGTNPGWSVRSVCVDDLDPTQTYDNGATIRIQNGAYNAFRKAELVNVSKARRENAKLNVTTLGNGIMRELANLYILDEDDSRYTNDKMANDATRYDIQEILNIITGNPTATNTASKTATMTQGEFANILIREAGLTKRADESSVDAAKRLGVVDASAFLTNDELNVSNYNLINAAYAALTTKNANGTNFLNKLIDSGFYNDKKISSISNSAFIQIYYSVPRKNPYTVVYDPSTGREFKYVNFFGEMLNRTYLTEHCWLMDGSGFICGTQNGDMFKYNIYTQMMTYLDTLVGGDVKGCVCPNGYIYYAKRGELGTEIWKIDPDTLEKECVYALPSGLSGGLSQVTNDGRYMALVVENNAVANKFFGCTDGYQPIAVIDFETGEINYRKYKFDYANLLNHQQVNPTDPNIVGFSHEAVLEEIGSYAQIYDRTWVMNMETGEAISFNQGRAGTNMDSKARQMFTHEMWSVDGEYRYLCCSKIGGDEYQDTGSSPGIIRFRKDGTHPQYYQVSYNTVGAANHAGMSSDGKMFMFDNSTVSLMSAETHQIFPIAHLAPLIGSKGHPYHPHPNFANGYNLVSWGQVHNGVLGVGWIDYTDILENEVARGGRYEFGENVTRVSYEGIECESEITEKSGVECAVAKPGSSLYLDVNDDYIDNGNCAVKITFDYYDNGTYPIKIEYTKGLEEYNDFWRIYNKKTNVMRTGTGAWKKAEIVLDCVNLQTIGKFETDFKFSSAQGSVFISNFNVEMLGTNE